MRIAYASVKVTASILYSFIIGGSCLLMSTGYRISTADYCDTDMMNQQFRLWGINATLTSETANYPEVPLVYILTVVVHIVCSCILWKKMDYDSAAIRGKEDEVSVFHGLCVGALNLPMVMPESRKSKRKNMIYHFHIVVSNITSSSSKTFSPQV